MSKTAFVNYGKRGFWAYDVALSVFLKHLIDAAEVSDRAKTAWLSTAISDWRVWACVSDFGFTVNPDWSAVQRQTFIALADAACTKLAERASIPAQEIGGWRLLDDDLRIFPRGAKEVLTVPVVELGRAIIALVSGELPEAPEGEIWFYGTPDGRQTLRMRSSR